MRKITGTRLVTTVLAATVMLVAMAAPALAQVQPQAASTGPSKLPVILGSIGVGAAMFLLVWLLFGTNPAVESDLRKRLGSYGQADPQDTGLVARLPLLRRFVTGAESVAERRGMFTTIESLLTQANIPLRPGEAIAGAIGLAALLGLITGAVMRSLGWGVAAGGLGLLTAVAVIQSAAGRERRKFESQLPDTLNLVSTSLRAGYSLLQAIEAVSGEAAEPTAREFSRALTEIRLGRSSTDALQEIAERMQSVDFDWAVLAIGIQREVGGNLAEVLQTAAETMLQRNRLRREMKALTAEGRISAIVLGALPIGLFTFLFLTNRSYVQPLLNRTSGILAIIGAVGLLLAGVFWLSKIVKVEV